MKQMKWVEPPWASMLGQGDWLFCRTHRKFFVDTCVECLEEEEMGVKECYDVE